MCIIGECITLWSQLEFGDKMIVVTVIILGLIIWGQGIVMICDKRKINHLKKQLRGEESEANPKSKSST